MIFGYVKVINITKKVRTEIQRRIDKNINEQKWNEGVMFVLDILETEM